MLQRKTAKPTVLLKVVGGNLAAECCCKEATNFLYIPCSEVPTPTPTPTPTPSPTPTPTPTPPLSYLYDSYSGIRSPLTYQYDLYTRST